GSGGAGAPCPPRGVPAATEPPRALTTTAVRPASGSQGNEIWSIHALSVEGIERLYIGLAISTASAASNSSMSGRATAQLRSWAGVRTAWVIWASSWMPAADARRALPRPAAPGARRGHGRRRPGRGGRRAIRQRRLPRPCGRTTHAWRWSRCGADWSQEPPVAGHCIAGYIIAAMDQRQPASGREVARKAGPIGYALAHAARAHRADLQRRLTLLGLHLGQELIVVDLHQHPGSTQAELVERIGIEQPTIAK